MQFWKIIRVAYRMKFQFQLQFSFPFNFPMKICIQGNKRWNMLPKLPRTKPLDWVSVGCGSHKATLAIQSKPCLVLVMLSLWLWDNCPKKGPLSTMVAMHTERITQTQTVMEHISVHFAEHPQTCPICFSTAHNDCPYSDRRSHYGHPPTLTPICCCVM